MTQTGYSGIRNRDSAPTPGPSIGLVRRRIAQFERARDKGRYYIPPPLRTASSRPLRAVPIAGRSGAGSGPRLPPQVAYPLKVAAIPSPSFPSNAVRAVDPVPSTTAAPPSAGSIRASRPRRTVTGLVGTSEGGVGTARQCTSPNLTRPHRQTSPIPWLPGGAGGSRVTHWPRLNPPDAGWTAGRAAMWIGGFVSHSCSPPDPAVSDTALRIHLGTIGTRILRTNHRTSTFKLDVTSRHDKARNYELENARHAPH